MTQEQKELLLKDLCARLPYGVKVRDELGRINKLVIGNNDLVRLYYNDFSIYSEEKLSLPYLFPLSSMTEEQKEDLYIVTNGKFNAGYKYIDNCKPRNWSEWGTTEYNWIRHYDIDLLYTWLNKNHFDYRGLISMGLAIDATNLNIY